MNSNNAEEYCNALLAEADQFGDVRLDHGVWLTTAEKIDQERATLQEDLHSMDFSTSKYWIYYENEGVVSVDNGDDLHNAHIAYLSASQALRSGAIYQFHDQLDRWTPSVDECTEMLQLAAQKGLVECVKRLVPISNPMADESRALLVAAAFDHDQTMELLLPHSDPSAARKIAIESGHIEAAERIQLAMARREAATISAEVGMEIDCEQGKRQRRM